MENMANDDQGQPIGTGTVLRNQQQSKPGKRPKNPLSMFASSTYQLSLYMVTPQAYDAFVASGRTQINSLVSPNGELLGGTYLVAQSGGINNATNYRASTNNLDYFIDNLSIKTFLTGQATMTASVDTEIRFQITEPYGFSFLSDLKRVADLIYGNSPDVRRPQNPTRQFFVLGLKFIGYDDQGNIINTQNAKDQTDPASDLFRIQDRYFDIMITDIKFKIAGPAVVYDVVAVALAPRISFGVARGTITTNVSAEGSTVEEVINDIIAKMNADQERVEDSISATLTRYKIRWAGPEEAVNKIKSASIISSTNTEDFSNKGNIPFSDIDNVNQVNDAQNINPNVTKKIIQIKNDTSIMQAIAQIITQSSYITDALDVVYASENQPTSDTGEYKSKSKTPSKNISWYTLGSEVRNAVWVPEISDFVYDIEYIIQPYETPVIQSPYGVSEDAYYGPYKRYEYWYTGQNSEVLSYEQTFNNAYYTVFLDETGANNGNLLEVPMVANARADVPRLGFLSTGAEAQNSIPTSLYDPASLATAQITIMGDPDFLMPDSPASERVIYDKWYAPDGFTINPHAGQTFIEINFKEARDYDIEKGYLTINDKILFWKYPDQTEGALGNIEGISYMVVDVSSTLKGGTFKQVLNCVVNPLSMVTKRVKSSSETIENLPVSGLLREASIIDYDFTNLSKTTGQQSTESEDN